MGFSRIRWRGVDLPFRPLVDNKRSGSVLEWLKDRQAAYTRNSSHPQRHRTADNLRPRPCWMDHDISLGENL
jgi:hypothetical protein